MNESLILRPSKKMLVLLFAASFIFVVIGVWMILDAHSLMGWISVFFFGLGMVVFFLQLLPNSSYLQLTSEGFIIKSLFREHPLIKWKDVKDFSVIQIAPNPSLMVGFNYDEDYPFSSKLRVIDKSLCEREGVIPDTYGLSAEKLCALMIEWQEKYLNERH